MKSLAGLSLDFIDDPGLIRDVDIPDHIRKVASSTAAITSRDFNSMHESDFGVVFLTKHGHHIPKYPIHDKFHTWAATVAFDKTAMKLPPAARSIAATFIKRACELHGVEYPSYMNDIEDPDAWSNVYDMNNPPKLASEIIQAAEGALLKNMSPDQRVAFRDKQNLSGDPGPIANAEAVQAALMIPAGPREAANKDCLEALPDTGANPHAAIDARQKMLQEIQATKTASAKDTAAKEMLKRRKLLAAMGILGAGSIAGGYSGVDYMMDEEEEMALPPKTAEAILSSDPTGLIKQEMIRKYASQFPDSEFALVVDGERHYPLYTPDLVKQAAVFFEANYEQMAPKYRREFAQKLAAKLASKAHDDEMRRRARIGGSLVGAALGGKLKHGLIGVGAGYFGGDVVGGGLYDVTGRAEDDPPATTPEQKKIQRRKEDMGDSARWAGALGGAIAGSKISPILGTIGGYYAGDVIADKLYRKYAGEDYGNNLESQLHMRKQCVQDKTAHAVLDVLYEKRASMSPENFAENLEQFDREHGLNGHWDVLIMDPYAATFAEKKAELDYFYEDGSQSITGEELRKLAQNAGVLREMFDDEFVNEFEKDAVAIFSSMPRPQKSLMIKAAKCGGLHDQKKSKKKVIKQANMSATESSGRMEGSMPSMGGKTRQPTTGDKAVEQGEQEEREPSWLEQHHEKTRRKLVDHHYKRFGPDIEKMTSGAQTPEEHKQKLENFAAAKQIAMEEAERLADAQVEDKVLRGMTGKSAADFSAPKVDASAGQKPLFGGKNPATTPVIPMGPNVSGVKTPGPRVAESSTKMAEIIRRIRGK